MAKNQPRVVVWANVGLECVTISARTWGLIVWAPLVLIGLVQSFRLGRRQLRAGEAPTAVALILWAAITWVVVTIYLPMAWDRYLLPPQSVNALLAALALSAIYDRVVHHIPLSGRGLNGCAGFLTVRRLVSSSSCWRAMRSSGIRATGMRLADSCSRTAMVDRGTVTITGLDRQTGDKALFHGQYYSDKLPGYSLLAALPYFVAKRVFGLPRSSSQSTGSGSLPLLGGRLLDHPGHIRHLDRLDGGPPRDRGSRAGMSSMVGGVDWPGLWLVDTRLRLCDARLRPSGFGVRLVRLVLAFMEEGPTARLGADLRRWRARGLRKRDRASSRPCVGDPWLVSARAMSQSRTTTRCFGDFLRRGIIADGAAPDLQPTCLWLALGNGLFPSRHASVRQGS